ncbi:unnamed protein product [Acanthoscelides obtectus]|uniref:Uncharacterized protein n=1 Tax=Acanthoscelides obtectus TaxID=200917 RepID=A0A9P0PDS0_ACAOB|nr:unnamed protein product [Acanthoscelides obtectus]CAK1672113.1 hypothetical protein AOBTE_LOCUS28652 [Acanthoscelides obtectus]
MAQSKDKMSEIDEHIMKRFDIQKRLGRGAYDQMDIRKFFNKLSKPKSRSKSPDRSDSSNSDVKDKSEKQI